MDDDRELIFGNCPMPLSTHETIQMSHGSGGKMMHDLITQLFVNAFDNPALRDQNDQAVFDVNGVRMAFTTDSYVVDPIFFPGGNIGDLAVNGTINDLAMCGARPLVLSCGFILEEGLPIAQLQTVVETMRLAAAAAGVPIVTGDTKVVNRGKGDKVFINTAGIGRIDHPHTISVAQIRPGDVVIVNGTIADHGIAILSCREGMSFETTVKSDCAALHGLVADIIAAGGDGVHAMRDPTRGGVAATLNEFAQAARVGIVLNEAAIPVQPAVRGACEMLGFDPLYVANEGKLIAVVEKSKSSAVLAAMQAHPLGRRAAIIGSIESEQAGLVSLRTGLGGWRVVDMPIGELLPRIC